MFQFLKTLDNGVVIVFLCLTQCILANICACCTHRTGDQCSLRRAYAVTQALESLCLSHTQCMAVDEGLDESF